MIEAGLIRSALGLLKDLLDLIRRGKQDKRTPLGSAIKI
jgi:hypothetical protein